MQRISRLTASLLLATLVAGGVLTPSLHRLAHVAAEAQERAAHVAAGHHHHEEADAPHGVELTPSCPTRVTPELDCAVCAGLSAHVAMREMVLAPPRLADRAGGTEEGGERAAHAAAASIRGPPVG